MDEGDLEPEEATPRNLVDQLRARRSQLCDRLVHVIGLERDVMHPRPALREEPPYMRVLARGGDELDAAVTYEERCGDDTLLAQRVAALEPGAEEPLVHHDRLIQIGHRDAEMVDTADVHPRDATRGRVSVPTRKRADGADRLRRARLGHDVGEQCLELGSIERLLLEQRLGHAVE